MSNPPAILTEGVQKSYGKTHALAGLDLDIDAVQCTDTVELLDDALHFKQMSRHAGSRYLPAICALV